MNAFEELVRKYPLSPRARYGKAQVAWSFSESFPEAHMFCVIRVFSLPHLLSNF